MGRRKIEIKPIKDDRNRSVTFLKRKGGLFKKAHELSVLCSVDVAVIIFGSNKKLYEYSSSDIGEILQRYQYYGAANEHKGPADFNGKRDDDDDDDDDMGSPPSHPGSVEPQMMHPHFPNPPSFQHIRNTTASESPPIPNGVPFHIQQQQQRARTPQPQPGSRPDSRNGVRRTSSNLAPPHMGQPAHTAPPNSFAFIPNPGLYQPHNGGVMPHPHQGPPYAYQGPPQQAPHPHMQQQVYLDDRRQAIPPNYAPQQDRQGPPVRASPQPPHMHIPQHQVTPPQPPPQQIPQQQQHHQHQQQPLPPHQPPQPQQEAPQQQMLEPVKRMPAKSKSIFTPIDENRSVLSQHWQTSGAEISRSEAVTSNRAQSVDVGSVARNGVQPSPPPPPPSRAQTNTQPPASKRNVSMSSVSSVPDGFKPPTRTNSAVQRPRLRVEIPDEPSDGGEATADPSSRGSGDANGTNVIRRAPENNNPLSSGVVLPPPSPSANSLLSAGATGPPNPFARPHPPQSQLQNRDNIETPVSALPSRFMGNEYLPSPSSFYPEWSFRGSDSNTMQSPLNFQTPVVGSGPSFLRDENSLKRKTPEMDEKPSGINGVADTNGLVVGDMKRMKHE